MFASVIAFFMKRYKAVLLNLIFVIYLVIVFIVTCVVSAHFLSQGTVDLTTDMSDATLPVMNIRVGEYSVNYLYGYTEPMDCAYMRDTLTVLSPERKVDYSIHTYGSNVEDIVFEIRSIDGSRLVESTEVYNYTTAGDLISGNITVKDLINKDEEYMLIFVLKLKNDQEIRYYSRLMWSENVYVQEKVEFVEDFCKKTFDKENASELTKYLESDRTGDNSSFNYANIHSSFKQITWGDLDIRMVGEPRVSICELTSATGYFKNEYQVLVNKEGSQARCNVTEYYRIRYTSERVYLLDWERKCNQIFEETENVYSGKQIELGFGNENIEIKECDGGNIFAFVDEGKLLCVNATDGKVVRVFSFYNEDYSDLRASHQEYDLHILNVDETGNVIFLVNGYLNRGIHEGHVGIIVYEYNSATNTIEEKAYVDYSKSASILRESLNNLSYVDRDLNVYFMLERSVYQIDIEDGNISITASNLQDNSYKVSNSGRMLVWQNDGDVYSCSKLRLMNLTTGISEDIKAGYGEYIRPLGFMDEDLVYGLARTKEVCQDPSGTMVFPMYKIVIRSDMGDILKEYQQDDIYVMDGTISEDMMYLERAEYNSNYGIYEETVPDQIMNTLEQGSDYNIINPVVTEAYETLIQISMKDEFADENIIHQTPREIMYEGSRELSRTVDEIDECYYVYGLRGYETGFLEAGNAVNYAYKISGIVLNNKGQYVWYKTGRTSKNQIMAITAPEETKPELSIAECIDAIFRFEGVTINSRVMLSRGQSAQELLEGYLDEATVLNLTGCNLDAILYYVNRDIPVMAVLNDSTAVLVTGFNDSQVVLYDPSKGELYKESMTDADNLFRTNGYRFITYMK